MGVYKPASLDFIPGGIGSNVVRNNSANIPTIRESLPGYEPIGGPLALVRKLDGTVAGLKAALQSAIELEHSTIPPYLYALYSIQQGRNQGSRAANLNNIFNYTYTSLLRSLHGVFNGSPSQLGAAIALMESLKTQAIDLMSTEIRSGMTAGPTFEYRPVV